MKTNTQAFIICMILSSLNFACGESDQVVDESSSSDDLSTDLTDTGEGELVLDPKMDPRLGRFVKNLEKAGVNESTKNLQAFSTALTKIKDSGKIHIALTLTSWDQKYIDELKKMEIGIERIYGKKIIQAWIPWRKLEDVGKLSYVEGMTQPIYGTTHVGKKTTEGDFILFTKQVRDTRGLTGAGVRIGVISDGAAGIFSSVASGDIPTGNDKSCDPKGIKTSAVRCQSFNGIGGIDSGAEGTAMLEIVHDMAPEADLVFANVATNLDMVEAIQFLADPESAGGAGCDIIVDDLGFFGEPYFEHGPVALAVKNVLDGGVHYVSAAGNSATGHIQEDFADVDKNGLHNFATGKNNYVVSWNPGTTLNLFLQWDDPFIGAPTNLDLLVKVCKKAGCPGEKSVDFKSDRSQPLFTAFEAVALANTGSIPLFAHVSVQRLSGPADVLLELFTLGSSANEYFDPEDSIFGHPAVDLAIAVGAVHSADFKQDQVEFFSSEGPATIDGVAVQKPDVVAVDGVQVTGNGGFPSPFFGTSAAAPHVAACLALVLEADPELLPDEAKDVLQQTAIDIEDNGFDFLSGSGRIHCLDAVDFALSNLDQEETVNPIDEPAEDVDDKAPPKEDDEDKNDGPYQPYY